METKRVKLIILMSALSGVLGACGSVGFEGTATGVDELASLNALAARPSDSVRIHFDRIDGVQIHGVSGHPGGGECNGVSVPCPANSTIATPPIQKLYASISGVGSMTSAKLQTTNIRGLNLMVTFNPTIANGQSCLERAQDAVINSLQFDIKGRANLVPIPVPMPGTAGGLQSSVGFAAPSASMQVNQIVTDVAAINAQEMPQPAFITLDVGVVLNQIDTCEEGGTVVSPPLPPIPLGPPPMVKHYAIHLSSVTGVTRAQNSSMTKIPGADGSMAVISGKGSFSGSFVMNAISMELPDVSANSACLDRAQKLIDSDTGKGLDIVADGWDLAIPMIACADNNKCPAFANVHLSMITSCQ